MLKSFLFHRVLKFINCLYLHEAKFDSGYMEGMKLQRMRIDFFCTAWGEGF